MNINRAILLILMIVVVILYTTLKAHKAYSYMDRQLRAHQPVTLTRLDKFCLKVNPHDFLLNHVLKYQSFIYLNAGDKEEFYRIIQRLYKLEPNNYSTAMLMQDLQKDSLFNSVKK
jgi:hypothetical protein